MKVNMTPNPLDVVTIHASQGDTEARQWEFELHNNGELIDTSDITEQLVFKAYKGGTEQLLPENGSTPTTSPFLGDIKYPQGLLTDQEFTYRQSPTEEDGLAKITDIKGNTIVWNQQLNDTGSTTTSNGITFTKNADGSITLNGTATAQADYTFGRFDYINGHKYLINGIPSGATVDGYRAYLFSSNETSNRIITATRDDWFTPRIRVSNGVTVSNVVFRLNIFDLTKMGLDSITSVGEFTSLFPSYYSYNQCSLLSFSGNGIKTVGKNLIDPSIIEYGKNWSGDTNATRANYSARMPYGQYTFSIQSMGTLAEVSVSVTSEKYGERSSLGGLTNSTKRRTVTVDANHPYVQFLLRVGSGTVTQADFESCSLMLESGSTSSDYEPYASSTLSLPISTYFPTGMKSAGNVYDELTESKAITRVGEVDLGTLAWNRTTSYAHPVFYANLMGVNLNGDLICTKFDFAGNYSSAFQFAQGASDNSISANSSGNNQIYVRADSIATVNDFKTYVNGVALIYGLAMPTEISFTTASLVTENAEIPLSNEDGVLIGKCTEELSAEPGFCDAKIKLTDSDGTCYSNKLQLHVERKPS